MEMKQNRRFLLSHTGNSQGFEIGFCPWIQQLPQLWRMNLSKLFLSVSIPALLFAAAVSAPAAQLSTDARTAVPHDVQQLVAIDYRAMENSTSATELKRPHHAARTQAL
jgi:hypothetical protein